MIRVALRGIRAHLVRFALAILAVALGVAFVAGTFSLRALLADTFEGIVEGSASAQAYVRGAGTVAGTDEMDGMPAEVAAPVPATLAAAIEDADGVERAFPDVAGPLVLVAADGTAVTTSGAPVMGLALYPDDPSLEVVAGTAPTRDDQIALETFARERAGLAIGDTTTIVVAGEVREVTVTGELGFGRAAAGAIMVGLDAASAERAYAPDGLVSSIAVFAADGVTEEQVTSSVAAFLAQHPTLDGASDATVVTGESLREDTRESINAMLGFIQVFLLTFAAVSLFVGGFLITNTFAMSVRERMREFALLRAMGASPGQVFASIVVQAFVVGLLGSAVGIAAGLGLAVGIGALLGSMGMDLAGTVTLTTATVVVSAVVGTVLSVVAAAIPARRAALTAPVIAMRGDLPSERGLRVRAIAGGVLTAAGIAGVAYAGLARTADGTAVDGAGAMLGIGAFALVVGGLVLAPVLARGAITALAAPVVALVKPLGALARGNVVRNPRRTAATAGALMIGMTLVSASSVLAASANSSIEAVVRSDLEADFIVQEQTGPLPAQIGEQIAALDSAGSVEELHGTVVYASGTEGPQSIVGVRPTMFTEALRIDVVEGDLASLADGAVLADRDAAKAAGWHVGGTVTLSTGTAGVPGTGVPGTGVAGTGSRAGAEPVTATIGAIVHTETIWTQLYVPQELFDELAPASGSTLGGVLVSAAQGVGHEQLRADLTAIAEPYYTISVADADDLATALTAQINGMLAIIYALLGLSIVIAVLGIVNTLALSIIERTREIALLRAVGLGRLQLSSTIAIESILTAVFGTLLGVAIGLGIATALPTVLASEGLSELVVPWGQIGVMVGLAALVGLMASLWPAVRASRIPVLAGLAAE